MEHYVSVGPLMRFEKGDGKLFSTVHNTVSNKLFLRSEFFSLNDSQWGVHFFH
jgi:hypothetical protein